MHFSLFGIINKIKQENFEGKISKLDLMIIIIIFLLLIWTIYVLIIFKLPREILIICIILLFITGPIIPLILAYLFKNKKIV